MDIKKKHERKMKKMIKYHDMEKCQIKVTREEPYQLKYLRKLREEQEDGKKD